MVVRCDICGKLYEQMETVLISNSKEYPTNENDNFTPIVMCTNCISKMNHILQTNVPKVPKDKTHLIVSDYIDKFTNYLIWSIMETTDMDIDNASPEEVFKLMSDYVVDKYYTTKCLKDFYTEFEYTPNRRIKQILQTSIDKVFTKTNELNLVKFCENYSNTAHQTIEKVFVDNSPKKSTQTATKLITYTPVQIKKQLDEYVIGQENAKKVVSVGIYNHFKRINKNLDINKSNILLIGPTGCGKTELARTIAKIFDVPFVIADVTSMTEAGYVGNNVEDMLVDLIMSAKGDIKKAEQGIIYIDEIDKIARTSNGNSEVSREGVQQSLLKIIEGDDIILEINHQKVKINTKNILFIAGGAFEDITMKEHTVKRGIGFNSEEIEAEYSNEIDTKSLVKFGLLPELIGRFPTIVSLNELSVDDLARILVEPKHSIIKQYKDLIKSDNVDITFSKKAINWVANKAYENKTGARGLKSILENNMLDVMFTLPDEKNVKKINVGVKNDKLNIVKKEN